MAWNGDPSNLDVVVVIGDTFTIDVTLADEVGAAIDLTGATGTALLLSEPGGATLATGTVTLTDAAAGEFRVTIAAATTAALAAQSGRWFVRFTFADATVRTVLEGLVRARRPGMTS